MFRIGLMLCAQFGQLYLHILLSFQMHLRTLNVSWLHSIQSLQLGLLVFPAPFGFYYPKIVKHWIWLVWINMLSLRSSALWIYSSQILEFELKILSQLGYLLLPTLWIPFLYGSFLVSKDFHGHGSNLGSEGFSGPINGPFSPSEQNLKNIFRARSRCNLSNDRLHE